MKNKNKNLWAGIFGKLSVALLSLFCLLLFGRPVNAISPTTVISYYQMLSNCSSYYASSSDMALLAAGSPYSPIWDNELITKGLGGSSTSDASGCYSQDSSIFAIPITSGSTFSFTTYLINPQSPSVQSILYDRQDGNTTNGGDFNITIQTNGSLRLAFNYSGPNNWALCQTDANVFNFDQANRQYRVIIQGTIGSLNTNLGIYVNGTQYSCTAYAQGLTGIPYTKGTSPIYSSIGYAQTPGAYYAYGRGISDTAIFNDLLTSDDIDYLTDNNVSDALRPLTTDYVQYNYSQGPAQSTIGPAQSTINKPVSWWVHYNVCDTGYTDSGSLELSVVDSTGIYDIGTSQKIWPTPRVTENCQGDFLYTGLVDTGSFGTSTVLLELSTVSDSDTVLQTVYSPGFTVTMLPEIIYSNGNINYGGDNPLIVNTNASAGTTTIEFDYNVCNQANYNSSHFALENLDTNEILNITASTTPCTGTSTMALPYAQDFVNTLNTRVDLVDSSNTPQILGNSFQIIWQIKGTGSSTSCNPPSYSITNICSDIDTSGVLGEIECGVKYALVSSAQFLFYPSCGSISSLTDTFYKFKNAFPFNTYFNFTDSINTAINVALNSTSTPGSFSIPFIKRTATSTAYYMLPIASSTSFSNAIGSTNYTTYRTTLGFIWWILAALIVFVVVTKI